MKSLKLLIPLPIILLASIYLAQGFDAKLVTKQTVPAPLRKDDKDVKTNDKRRFLSNETLHAQLSDSSSQRPPSYMELYMDARDMTDEEVKTLENRVFPLSDKNEEISPNLIQEISALLVAYSLRQFESKEILERKNALVLWLIQNKPSADILGEPDGTIFPNFSGDAVYDQGIEIWQKQLQKTPDNITLLSNAVNYAFLDDTASADTWLRQLQKLDPANSTWSEKLSFLYSLKSMHSNNLQDWQESFLEAERALSLSSDAIVRRRIISSAIMPAIELGDLERASKWAMQLLEVNSGKFWDDYSYEAHQALGRIALRKNDFDVAARELLASISVDKDDLWVGYKFELARELVQRGLTEPVLTYLRKVEHLETNDVFRDRQTRWRTELETTGTSNFE